MLSSVGQGAWQVVKSGGTAMDLVAMASNLLAMEPMRPEPKHFQPAPLLRSGRYFYGTSTYIGFGQFGAQNRRTEEGHWK